MTSPTGPLLLLAAAGLFQAAFAAPVRHLRRWRWEQMWVAQSLTANLLFPLCWAALAPAAFWVQAAQLPRSHWVAAYAWGLVWGLGGAAWGLTMTRLGMAFSNTFVFGVTTMTGALVPLAVDVVETPPRPALFAAGLLLCLLTTALIGFLRRHAGQQPLLPMPVSFRSYRAMIAVALFAGISSAGYGLAFTFSFPHIRSLMEGGVSPVTASLAVVLPVYLGAATVAIPLGVAIAIRARGLPLFFGKNAGWNWSLAAVMGLCAAASALFYGFAASEPGHPSPNVSFGVFISFLVFGSNLMGFSAGELRGCPQRVGAGLLFSAGGLVAGAWLLTAQ